MNGDRINFIQYGDYEVYGYDGETKLLLCYCIDRNVAHNIAIKLASLDKDHDRYYVSSINWPGCLIPGGGNCDVYWFDDNGKMHHECIS